MYLTNVLPSRAEQNFRHKFFKFLKVIPKSQASHKRPGSPQRLFWTEYGIKVMGCFICGDTLCLHQIAGQVSSNGLDHKSI